LSTTLSILIGVAITLALLALLSRAKGFHTQKPADFAAQTPTFDLKRHLNGPILCEGVIYGPLGRVTSRFVADMYGSWDGDTGTLKETFRYDSGTVQDRCWTLHLTGNTIRAEAPDVPQSGTGTVQGSAVQMRYPIRLTPEAGGHVLQVTDWMYLMENGTIINRSQFTKFGFTVAELVATMRPVKDAA
jgi:Protein of unknown function (DUF3833)